MQTTANLFDTKMAVFRDVAPYSLVKVYRRFRGAYYLHQELIALMMEAVSTCETEVNYQNTQRKIPEGSHLHTSRCENPKSQVV
jgi:hypothetical protein